MVEQKNLQIDYDLVIVGAGLSGCLLAHAILKESPHLKVALLDDNPEQLEVGRHPGFDARSIALSAGSCSLLQDLGLWSVLKEKAQAIDDIDISDRGHFGALTLSAAEQKESFGYVVELHYVGEMINRQLATYLQLTRFYNTRVLAIDKHVEYLDCQLQDKSQLKTRLCIAADGANSLTRDLLNISSHGSNYGCTAIVANVRCSQAHQNKAYERFTENGPIALLPLTDNRYSLVWSVKNADLSALNNLREADFLSELQQAFGYRAGIFKSIGKHETYPLKLINVAQPYTHRGICIGNAAHCLHPVMGQGFNLGLRDLYLLAKVIARGQDKSFIGNYSMINQYWSTRQSDQNTTLKMTDSVVRIFSSHWWPLVAGRNCALQVMRRFPRLALPIVKQAKGQFNLKGIKNDPIL